MRHHGVCHARHGLGAVDRYGRTSRKRRVVVTGTRTLDVAGVSRARHHQDPRGARTPSSSSARRRASRSTRRSTTLPGVSFTNNDPFGSAGGTFVIRGFDNSRISETFDGIPLNDTGNYALFSNQLLDPELIEQVNVSLGSTDVDSPTASATGSTVNFRTRLVRPDRFGPRRRLDRRRAIFRAPSGSSTPASWDRTARALSSPHSNARNDLFRGPGEIYKQQYNARIYQPIGDNGDFVSISGHYNQNRNNFYRNPAFNDLRTTVFPPGQFPGATGILGTGRVAAASTAAPSLIGADYSGNEWDAIFNFNNFDVCTRASEPGGAGAQNDNGGPLPNGTGAQLTGGANNVNNTSSCSNFFGVRINPSNTGNIRINGRFTLADNLILTVDPSFQYVLANGGGSTAIAENNVRVRGGTPASPGVDYNGDGDFLDTIRFYTPNNTNTHRLGLTASLIWDINDDHRLRFAYTFDRARHRQTGEWGFLGTDGHPESPFSGRNATPVLDATGFQFQQRDRLSIAMLNQIAGQYIGRFMDDRLRVEVGLRVPFFKRELEQRCYTEARGSAGFAYCSSEPVASLVIIAPNAPVPAAGPTPYYAPFTAEYSFDAILPNVGLRYDFGGGFSVFGSYARGFSSPRTDNLYRQPIVVIDPETTDAFDLGVRYRRSNVQAQATAWLINYQNRIVSSFNPDLGLSVDRNVGKVESWGVDASVGWDVIPELSLFALGAIRSRSRSTKKKKKRRIALAGGHAPPQGALRHASHLPSRRLRGGI